LVQEEFRQNTRDGTSSKEVEEDFDLVRKRKTREISPKARKVERRRT